MLSNSNEWWTDERVAATVTAHYIYSHLPAVNAEKLNTRVFSTTFSDDTYLQWIISKTKRLFLTLVAANISGQIFRFIEESYDDEDLPIAEEDLCKLGLPREHYPRIEQLFYQCQFRYLLRVIEEGEHIRYARSEIVPVQSLQQKSVTKSQGPDQVRLATDRILIRRRISLDEVRNELDILSEIAASKSTNHEHILSIFGSYLHDGSLYVLTTPSPTYTLKSFLSDSPKSFATLSKLERRQRLMLWMSCLSNALAWLHSQGLHHGAVRPSRIMIDELFQPTLGHFEGEGVLCNPTAKDDLEAYQYGAPEHWRRELTVQGGSTPRPSATRVGRSSSIRQGNGLASSKTNNDSFADQRGVDDTIDRKDFGFLPTSKGNPSRLKLELLGHREKVAILPARNMESRMMERADDVSEKSRFQQSLYRRFDTLSIHSSNSSEAGRRNGSQPQFLYATPVETKNTVVQTWKSFARDMPAADVFGMAAVIMDILTVLCARTISAFAKHRSSKNRQAGRGGGLADASFHANLTTISSWAEDLHKEAGKKLKKDQGSIFRVVGPVLQLALQCLDKEPANRIEAEPLARQLERHVNHFAELDKLHCALKLAPRSESKSSTHGKAPRNGVSAVQPAASRHRQSAAQSPVSAKSTSTRETILLDHLDKHHSDLPESFKSYRPSVATMTTEYDIQSELAGEYAESSSEYYDAHPGIRWDAQQLRGLSPKPLKLRGHVRIAPSVSDRDFSITSSPPSLMSRTTGTHRSNYDRSEPSTPIFGSHSFAITPASSVTDYHPPDRDLPPIPRSYSDHTEVRGRKDAKTRDMVNPTSSVNVGHATQLLAETVKPRPYREIKYGQFQQPIRKSSRTPLSSQPRYIIQADDDEEYEDDYRIYGIRENEHRI